MHVFPGQQVAEAAHITQLLGWGKHSPFFVVADAQPTVISVISKDGKVTEELHSVSSLISKSLKPEVTFCLERTVKVHSVSLLLSLAKSGTSSGRGTGLSPQLFDETGEGLAQTPIRHPSKHTAPSLLESVRGQRASHCAHRRGRTTRSSSVSSLFPGAGGGISAQLSVKFCRAMIRRAPDSSSSPR